MTRQQRRHEERQAAKGGGAPYEPPAVRERRKAAGKFMRDAAWQAAEHGRIANANRELHATGAR